MDMNRSCGCPRSYIGHRESCMIEDSYKITKYPRAEMREFSTPGMQTNWDVVDDFLDKRYGVRPFGTEYPPIPEEWFL